MEKWKDEIEKMSQEIGFHVHCNSDFIQTEVKTEEDLW